MDAVADVKDLTKKVTASQNEGIFTIQWFGSIYNGLCGFSYYDSASGSAMNALALVTCLATNLEALDF
jgi:hypothetical protein